MSLSGCWPMAWAGERGVGPTKASSMLTAIAAAASSIDAQQNKRQVMMEFRVEIKDAPLRHAREIAGYEIAAGPLGERFDARVGGKLVKALGKRSSTATAPLLAPTTQPDPCALTPMGHKQWKGKFSDSENCPK